MVSPATRRRMSNPRLNVITVLSFLPKSMLIRRSMISLLYAQETRICKGDGFADQGLLKGGVCFTIGAIYDKLFIRNLCKGEERSYGLFSLGAQSWRGTGGDVRTGHSRLWRNYCECSGGAARHRRGPGLWRDYRSDGRGDRAYFWRPH